MVQDTLTVRNGPLKVRMVEWIGNLKGLPDWFKSGHDAELSWDNIKELYDTGYNIMLVHSGDQSTLFVDDKRFTQR